MFVECCRCAAAKEQRDHMRAMGHPIPDSEDSDAEDDSVGSTHIFLLSCTTVLDPYSFDTDPDLDPEF
jgi:hypothetical protein